MNVEIRTEVVQFPENKCINGIFLAVHVLTEDSAVGVVSHVLQG
jgi:hypothetical protein